MKEQRAKFIKDISELENIEIAFMNKDYKKIIQLWNNKIIKATNSLELLFSLLQFSLEERTILFVNTYIEYHIVYEHLSCFYELQSFLSDIVRNWDENNTTTLYYKELKVKINTDYLIQFLLKTKQTITETILRLYRKYLPLLNDDIIMLIIHYIFIDYRL